MTSRQVLRLGAPWVVGLIVLSACAGATRSDDDDDDDGTAGTGGSSGSSSVAGGGSQGGGAAGAGASPTGGSGGKGGSTGGSGGSNAGGGAGGGAGTGGGSAAGSSGANTSGTGGDGGSGGTSTLAIATCTYACSTAADCVSSSGAPAYDEDNYRCEDGTCLYSGCHDDAECDATSAGTKCADSGVGFACSIVCATVADCDLGLAAYDADNMECRDGGCFYLGCHDDAECGASYEGYRCRDTELGFASCAQPCVTPADCAVDSAVYDEDNYECRDGGCVWVGCNSDSECQTLGSAYVCR